MVENNDDVRQTSCLKSFLSFLDRAATRLRIRLDSFIYQEYGIRNVFWIQIKLDVLSIYFLILTLIYWIYQIYK